MLELFVKRLRRSGLAIGEDDIQLMEGAARLKHLAADKPVVLQGDSPKLIHILLSGMTCRYKVLPSGRRQLTGIMVPGDTCDLHGLLLRRMDHSVKTLGDCTFAEFARPTVLDWFETRSRLTKLFWWISMADEAVLREWLANVGRQDAKQRIAHLFCDLLLRLKAVGLAQDDSYDFLLTQEELGDLTGLSTVHVNRTLQELRSSGAISLRGRRLTVSDVVRLQDIGAFDPSYLEV